MISNETRPVLASTLTCLRALATVGAVYCSVMLSMRAGRSAAKGARDDVLFCESCDRSRLTRKSRAEASRGEQRMYNRSR